MLVLLIILLFRAKSVESECFRALEDGGRHREDREEVSKRHQKQMCERRDLINRAEQEVSRVQQCPRARDPRNEGISNIPV